MTTVTFRSKATKTIVVALIVFFWVLLARNAHAAPPQYWIDTALKIGRCEQPSGRPGKWASVNWKNETNYSFLGGMGMTNLLWATFKKRGQPERMSHATPMQQITAAWNFYLWAEKTYPGYGYTGWECSYTIGFRGFNGDGTWK